MSTTGATNSTPTTYKLVQSGPDTVLQQQGLAPKPGELPPPSGSSGVLSAYHNEGEPEHFLLEMDPNISVKAGGKTATIYLDPDDIYELQTLKDHGFNILGSETKNSIRIDVNGDQTADLIIAVKKEGSADLSLWDQIKVIAHKWLPTNLAAKVFN